MHPLPHIAGLVLNTPLLCTPAYSETICAVLGARIGVDSAGMVASGDSKRAGEPYMTDGNTLVIPVIGSMSHRALAMDAMSGITSYESLQAQVEDAMSMNSVSRIALDMNTPGGLVSGAFDFADYLHAQRGRKPIHAIARDGMMSAGYLLGSSTDRVITTQTGQVGSIGVVMMHMDRSQQLENEGVRPTLIFAGEDKVLGNPVTPLSDSDLAKFKAEVNDSYELFVGAVARNRPMTAEAIRATEAGIFTGQKAVEAGLADEVGTIEGALEQLSAGGPKTYPVSTMSTQQPNEENMEREEILAEGAATERTRISAIMGSDVAKGRSALASHFALSTDMSAEAALAALAVSPVEEAAQQAAAPAEPTPANSATPAPQAAAEHVQTVLGADAAGVPADGSGAKAELTADEKKAQRIEELRGVSKTANAARNATVKA